MDRDYLVSIIKYIIDDHTISETASFFDKSVSSIKKYIASFRENASDSDKLLLEKLNLTLKKNALNGKIKGGAIGKRGKTYEEFTARMYAEAYLSGKTLMELSESSKIPKSTLHEMIRGIDDSKLQQEIDEYIRGSR